MELIINLLKLFSESHISDFSESFKELNINLKTNIIKVPDEKVLERLLEKFPLRDNVHISIKLDNCDSISLLKHKYTEFLDELRELNSLKENDSIFNIQIDIEKYIDSNNVLSIYNLGELGNFIKIRTLKQVLFMFAEISKGKQFIHFDLINNSNETFYSHKYYFCGKNTNLNKIFYNSVNNINKRNKVCYFLNAKDFDFDPDDFKLIVKSKDKNINMIFHKLYIIFSLIYISNVSKIDDENILNINIEGYKTFDLIVDYTNMEIDKLETYYDIYSWVYDTGNLIDKIGLARNIISLYLCRTNTLNIDGSILDSIKSNYRMYLKENIKEYLEVKNKIVEFINDMTQKTSEIANSLGESFYNNIKAALTFYVTIVIMNILSDKRLDNIFTKDIIILSVMFVIFSYVFMIFSKNKTEREIQRFKVRYKRLKESYNEVLDNNDIKEIFKNDKYYNEDIKFIDEKIKNYTDCWRAILLIMIIAIIIICLFKAVILSKYIFMYLIKY